MYHEEETKNFFKSTHFFESDSSVTFVDGDSKFVLDALYCEVLPYGFHLFTNEVVVVLLLPLFLDVVQRFLEDVDGSNC